MDGEQVRYHGLSFLDARTEFVLSGGYKIMEKKNIVCEEF
jgi:hypothetical protein